MALDGVICLHTAFALVMCLLQGDTAPTHEPTHAHADTLPSLVFSRTHRRSWVPLVQVRCLVQLGAVHAHARMYTRTHACAHSLTTHKHMHALTHTRAHARAHTRTHTHTHTHTHTVLSCACPPSTCQFLSCCTSDYTSLVHAVVLKCLPSNAPQARVHCCRCWEAAAHAALRETCCSTASP